MKNLKWNLYEFSGFVSEKFSRNMYRRTLAETCIVELLVESCIVELIVETCIVELIVETCSVEL